MSTQSSDLPSRVFTWCELPARYYDRYISARSAWVALIFVDRDEPSQAVKDLPRLMQHRYVRDVMEELYVGGSFRWTPNHRTWLGWGGPADYQSDNGSEYGVIISQRLLFLPDSRRICNASVYVMVQGLLHHYTVDELVEPCRQVYRLMRCEKCPEAGEVCLAKRLRVPLPQPSLPGLGDSHLDWTSDALQEGLARQQATWDSLKDYFTPWKDDVEGYVYIPPALASGNPSRPGLTVEPPHHLDFHEIESARDALSARSRAGIETRRVKRQECPKCYFGGTGYRGSVMPCSTYRPRNCRHGAWTEEQALRHTTEPFLALLTSTGFQREDFQGILGISGIPFRRPTKEGGYAKWIVSKLDTPSPPDKRVRIRLKRVSRDHRHESEDLDDLAALWRVLPSNLRRTFQEARNAPALEPQLLATAIQLTACHTIKPYTCMRGCIREAQPDISHIAAKGWRIEVGYWLTTYWRTMHFTDLLSVFNYFEGLPVFRITHEDEDLSYTYSVWPRQGGLW